MGGLMAEVKHREYFFSNHLNKALIDTHQVEYIYMFGNKCGGVILKLLTNIV
jgi:hypothetical protein